MSRPIEDQSYGDRAGQLKDPFGYTWMVATHKQDVSVADMQKGFDDYLTEREQPKKFKREGYHAVTPYLIVKPAVELVDFVKQAFGAVELFRTTGSAGGLHCEVKIGDSMVMIGGGPTFDTRPICDSPARFGCRRRLRPRYRRRRNLSQRAIGPGLWRTSLSG